MRSFFKSLVSRPETPPVTMRRVESAETEGANDNTGEETAAASSRVNDMNKKRRTALHKAVRSGFAPMVRSLVATEGVDFNFADYEGNLPLHYAARLAEAEILGILLPKSNASRQNSAGETPLHLAVIWQRLSNVQALLPVTNIDAQTSGGMLISGMLGQETALHYAFRATGAVASEGFSPEIAMALVRAGIDVNLPDSRGRSAIHRLIKSHHVSLMEPHTDELFRSFNLNIKSADVVLFDAAMNKAMPAAMFRKLLVKYIGAGKSINIVDGHGHSPLYYVVSQSAEKLRVLLEFRPKLDLDSDESPLERAASENKPDAAIKLLELGAKPNRNSEKSALYHAARHGNLRLIQTLKDRGATFEGTQGELAVKKALLENQVEALILLIQLGANADVHVSRAENEASSFGSFSSREEDDKTGCLTNGDTPLHYAVMKGNKELAAACLKQKPDMVNSMNGHGKTPAHFAIKVLRPEMAYLLNTQGSDIQISVPSPGFRSVVSHSLLMQAATRAFKSQEDLDDFFTKENYQLSEEQKAIQAKVFHRYFDEKPREVSVSGSGLSFIGSMSSAPASGAPLARSHVVTVTGPDDEIAAVRALQW